MNILHPPSHSPVPGPGIPLPSNGRLVPSLFLFLSVSVTHNHTQTYSLLSLCNYSKPSFLTCHIHFLISSLQPFHPLSFLHFLPFLPSFSPFNNPPSSSRSPSAALSFGFICMAERKGCRQCEQGQQSPPVSIQARAEICNARQH